VGVSSFVSNFDDVAPPLDCQSAPITAQSCYDAPCIGACPAGIGQRFPCGSDAQRQHDALSRVGLIYLVLALPLAVGYNHFFAGTH